MTKLAINAINLSSAGGLNVALNFLNQLQQLDTRDWETHVFAPKNCGYEQYENDHLQIHCIPDYLRKYAFRSYTDFVWLPAQIKALQPDVIFSMGNFAVPGNIKQAVLYHYPHAIYLDDQPIWDRMAWKDWVINKLMIYNFRSRIKYAHLIFPQTQTAKQRLHRTYHIPNEKMLVVPNAYTLTHHSATTSPSLFEKESGLIYLLCLSRYYPHKNIESFLALAALIKEKNAPYRIVTTVGASQNPKAAEYIQNIQQQGLGNIILNLGPVPSEAVAGLYHLADGMILPTLLESFSANYVDAMHFGRPIFTSDRDFASEICGDAAFYFDPLAVTSMYDTIHAAFQHQSAIEHKVRLGKIRSAQFPDWSVVASQYLENIKKLCAE